VCAVRYGHQEGTVSRPGHSVHSVPERSRVEYVPSPPWLRPAGVNDGKQSRPRPEEGQVRMAEEQQYEAKSVLVVVAHPDDAEFMAAGTIGKWAQEGKEINYVVCTPGDKGTTDRSMPT